MPAVAAISQAAVAIESHGMRLENADTCMTLWCNKDTSFPCRPEYRANALLERELRRRRMRMREGRIRVRLRRFATPRYECVETDAPYGTQAIPSGPIPAWIFFVTCHVFRSMTAMKLSPFTAT